MKLTLGFLFLGSVCHIADSFGVFCNVSKDRRIIWGENIFYGQCQIDPKDNNENNLLIRIPSQIPSKNTHDAIKIKANILRTLVHDDPFISSYPDMIFFKNKPTPLHAMTHYTNVKSPNNHFRFTICAPLGCISLPPSSNLFFRSITPDDDFFCPPTHYLPIDLDIPTQSTPIALCIAQTRPSWHPDLHFTTPDPPVPLILYLSLHPLASAFFLNHNRKGTVETEVPLLPVDLTPQGVYLYNLSRLRHPEAFSISLTHNFFPVKHEEGRIMGIRTVRHLYYLKRLSAEKETVSLEEEAGQIRRDKLMGEEGMGGIVLEKAVEEEMGRRGEGEFLAKRFVVIQSMFEPFPVVFKRKESLLYGPLYHHKEGYDMGEERGKGLSLYSSLRDIINASLANDRGEGKRGWSWRGMYVYNQISFWRCRGYWNLINRAEHDLNRLKLNNWDSQYWQQRERREGERERERREGERGDGETGTGETGNTEEGDMREITRREERREREEELRSGREKRRGEREMAVRVIANKKQWDMIDVLSDDYDVKGMKTEMKERERERVEEQEKGEASVNKLKLFLLQDRQEKRRNKQEREERGETKNEEETGGKETGEEETGRKETGEEETGRKETGEEETGRKETVRRETEETGGEETRETRKSVETVKKRRERGERERIGKFLKRREEEIKKEQSIIKDRNFWAAVCNRPIETYVIHERWEGREREERGEKKKGRKVLHWLEAISNCFS